jgi:hypothetical protein
MDEATQPAQADRAGVTGSGAPQGFSRAEIGTLLFHLAEPDYLRIDTSLKLADFVIRQMEHVRECCARHVRHNELEQDIRSMPLTLALNPESEQAPTDEPHG